MKPAIIVKTKANKRYVQLRTADGELIHIGPASNIKNWQTAALALADEYDDLILDETVGLAPLITQEGLDWRTAISPISRDDPEWQKYLEKVNAKFDKRKKMLDDFEKRCGVTVARTPWEEKWAKHEIREEE